MVHSAVKYPTESLLTLAVMTLIITPVDLHCPDTVDGYWSVWSSWSKCSQICGLGTRMRKRSCSNPPPLNGGKECLGSGLETNICEGITCPVNGSWSDWSKWSECSLTYGDGIRTRRRNCINPSPSNGGKLCAGPSLQGEMCRKLAFAVNDGWSGWSSWSRCAQTCGGGVRTRTRACIRFQTSTIGRECTEPNEEKEVCNNKTCPVNGGWSTWGNWSACSQTCGGGVRWRSRTCTNPTPSNGGTDCPGPSREREGCESKSCAVDGGWSNWGNWSECSQTCGEGIRRRNRTCTNPLPSNGGTDCPGPSKEREGCNEKTCAVAGGWTVWGSWSECTQTCGGGVRLRSRTCTNPSPSNGGTDCPGPRLDRESCNTNSCKVDGGWTVWGNWGECSSACGGGVRIRRRYCTNPPPSDGGADCSGPRLERDSCNNTPCKNSQVTVDECGQHCVRTSKTSSNCYRLRQEFTSMSREERIRYITVVKTAARDKKYRRDYKDLLEFHKKSFKKGIYKREQFLPWHRWFLLQYENFLRRIDCRITVPYWDWSLMSHNPWRTLETDLWNDEDSGFGGTGVASNHCVKTGPFGDKDWEPVPSVPNNCVKRNFSGNPPDAVAVTQVQSIPAREFQRWETSMRINLHHTLPCLISGTMCSDKAVSAPEFFLHQGFIDKLWADWQDKSQEHKSSFYSGLDKKILATKTPIHELIDLDNLPGGVRVRYVRPNSSIAIELGDRLKGLEVSELRKIPRSSFVALHNDSLRLFKVATEDIAAATKENNRLNPLKKVKLREGNSNEMELCLGFRLQDIDTLAKRKAYSRQGMGEPSMPHGGPMVVGVVAPP